MRSLLTIPLTAVLLCLAVPLAGQHSTHHRKPRHAPKAHVETKRSRTAKDEFLRQTGHPHGWPGHVVDHIVPLACGGADDPSNMQWMSTEDAKAKDRVERQGCTR